MNKVPMDGLLGVCLSGSGSTIMAIATGHFEEIALAMQAALALEHQSAHPLILEIDTAGSITSLL